MSPDLALPNDYAALLSDLKAQIHTAQTRAALSVNRELVLLYWYIGRVILSRQQAEGWGAKVIDQLSRDLKAEFPDIKGFSPRNLKYMQQFAAAWPDEQMVQQLVAQTSSARGYLTAGESGSLRYAYQSASAATG